jgi:hypothetical protein
MPVVVNYPPPSSVVVNEVTGAVTVVQSGKPGPQGAPGVVTATSPATYHAPTQTVGVDQTAIAIQPSQVAGTAVVDSDTRLVPAGGSAGQVLVKASATNFDTGWLDNRFSFVAESGLYFKPPGNHPSLTVIADRLSFVPIEIASCQIDRIAVVVTTGAAGSLVRLGIYNSNSAGYPGNLFFDAGTVDSSTTGLKEITVNQTLQPGRYWLAGVGQGGTPTLTGVGAVPVTNLPVTIQRPAGPATANFLGWNTTIPFQTGVSGALPGTANAQWDFGSANGLQIGLRVA